MKKIKPQSGMSDNNEPAGVIPDLQNHKRTKEMIEDYGPAKLMEESDDDEPLSRNEALKYYNNLRKT
ncbi:hypothetical protein [Methanoplanus endosymbiosus]|uniref:Uncharacterized protein n=1 Tax=Methanoplanus endosymbiosus TaxID=33865 RepID=A0A9E7PL84_9EURY|nr:hypothetical protein [Methanoplanus endosymbiosus]UUX91975.1 hypothetical protein L6E24_11495 [Methanoplanus endosymbiosus]